VPFTAVPLKDLVHDLPAMAAAVTPKTRILFVANPNNPTGTHVGRAAVETLLREVPPDVIVVMDEAYFEYADAPDYRSALELRHLRERLIVMRTFSKAYGLAALRVGYAIGPAALIDYMNRVRAPFNVTTMGQAAAIAALDDRAHVENSVAHNSRERVRIGAALAKLGVKVAPTQANFVLADVGRPARPVYDALLRRGVIVRPFASLPASLRVTFGSNEENDRFIGALAEVLA
jgi:histidinol-phosphate aminotransferase